MKTLVIIPAYNEEESILKTINEFNRQIKGVEETIDYVVINDGSKDNTKDVLEKNNIFYLEHVINKGLDAAVKTGITYALKNDYDYITQFDGDGQHNSRYLPEMINMMSECDIVIGSRFLGGKKPWSMRMLGSKVLSNLIFFRVCGKQRITDPTSGQRMMNQKVMKSCLEHSSASEPSVVTMHINKGFVVKEILVEMNEREAGESYLNFSRSIYYMIEQTLAIFLGY